MMKPKKRTAKEKHRIELVEYLANPENKFPTRDFLATEVLGFSVACSIYQCFTPAELSDIEAEALQLRRHRYAASFAAVDKAMIEKALEGDAVAAKLIYQRLEGWNPAQKVEADVTLSLADLVNDLD